MKVTREFVFLEHVMALAREVAGSSELLHWLSQQPPAEAPLQLVADQPSAPAVREWLASYMVECFLQRETLRLFGIGRDSDAQAISRDVVRWPEHFEPIQDLAIDFSHEAQALSDLRRLYRTRQQRYPYLNFADCTVHLRDLRQDHPQEHKVVSRHGDTSCQEFKLSILEADLPSASGLREFLAPNAPPDRRTHRPEPEAGFPLRRGRPSDKRDTISEIIWLIWPNLETSLPWGQREEMVIKELRSRGIPDTEFHLATLKRAWKAAQREVLKRRGAG